jgi:hypothetical protein
VIFIEPLPDYVNPAPGEIIAWKRESGFVVHRLVRIVRSGEKIMYFTRGDSCDYEDQPVTRDQIAGKVIRTENQKKQTKEGYQLVRKSCYFLNRQMVWLLIKLRRIFIISRE